MNRNAAIRTAGALAAMPWALRPEVLAQIGALLEHGTTPDRANGRDYNSAISRAGVSAIEKRDKFAVGRRAASAGRAAGPGSSIAVIPVFGLLTRRASWLQSYLGGTGVDQLAAAFRMALSDPSFGGILFRFDSPGGEVGGIPELAAEILAARGRKPIAAAVDGQCCSGSYWLAAAADSLYAAPSSEVGSIGVYALHEDFSRQLEMAGLKVTLIQSAEYKTEGNPFQPLGAEARGFLQKRADEIGAQFTDAIARSRGKSVGWARSKDGAGQGRVFSAAEAKARDMVDRIGTYEDAIGDLQAGRITSRPASPAPAARAFNSTAGADLDLRQRLLEIERGRLN
jgi:signal peptide peptidase SppA